MLITNDPKILALAFIGGIIPSLVWLWFWIKEEENKPEPKRIVSAVFIMGMVAVICVIPIQKFIQSHIISHDLQLTLFAASEEIIKYLAVLVVLYHTDYIKEPIDWPIFLITAALGFAALENALYLLKPLSEGQNIAGILTGELRFLGSTLLHAVASGILGIAFGISLHCEAFKRFWHVCVGFIFAIALHNIFNFFIIKNSGNNFLKVFGFLWVVTIIVMLLFEKVRRMN